MEMNCVTEIIDDIFVYMDSKNSPYQGWILDGGGPETNNVVGAPSSYCVKIFLRM